MGRTQSTTASLKIKHPKISLPINMQKPHENYKILLRVIKEDKKINRHIMVVNVETRCYKTVSFQNNLYI